MIFHRSVGMIDGYLPVDGISGKLSNLEDKKQRKENVGNGLIVRNERPLVALSA